jgi:hypothetical protein
METFHEWFHSCVPCSYLYSHDRSPLTCLGDNFVTRM